MADPVKTFIERFGSAAGKFPERVAIHTESSEYTYAELERASQNIAAIVCRHEGQNVGVVTGDDALTIAAIIGILGAGKTYVPLNTKNPISRNIAIADSAEVATIITSSVSSDDPLCEALRTAGYRLIEICADQVAADSGQLLSSAEESDCAYIFFTSGSTGTPKGVPVSHGNLGAFLGVMLDQGIYDFTPEDRFLQMFELTFDLSVMSIFVPLSVGASCCIVPDSRIGYSTTQRVLRQQNITVALMVPSVLTYLQPYFERLRLPALRLTMFCGEALKQSLVEAWGDVAPNSAIENVYGPTEATIFCSRYVWNRSNSGEKAVNGLVPIGIPLPGTEFSIIDEEGHVLDSRPGTKGELCLSGSQVVAGYWKNPEKTGEQFISLDGVMAYKTGDLCSVDADGDFVYSGRKDSQVKVNGHRIEIGDVEFHLSKASDRASLAVVDVDSDTGVKLVAFFQEPEINWQPVDAKLRELVPAYMLPTEIRFIKEMPLNLNGKIDRNRLREMCGSET